MLKKIVKFKKIKIPKNISVFFNYSTNFFVIKGLLDTKILKFPFKIFFTKKKRHIVIVKNSFSKNFNLKNKNFYFYVIKKSFLEVSKILTKKLVFIGLGYRFFFLDTPIPLLKLKLGYSHDIFFKPSFNLNYNYVKNTSLFLQSTDYNYLNLISSRIKSYKTPNTYKKKGIYYSKEKILLKKFKKI